MRRVLVCCVFDRTDICHIQINDIDELITRGESIEHADGDAQSETAEPQSSSTVETRVVVRRVLPCDPCLLLSYDS